VPTFTTATTEPNTCVGNGEIHVSADIPDLIYSIQSGSVTVSKENDHGNFYSLPAGTYVVRAYNPAGAGCYSETTVVIDDAYEPFSFTLSVTNVCTDGDAGTIIVNLTEGSSTPLMVAYWQDYPSMPDAI